MRQINVKIKSFVDCILIQYSFKNGECNVIHLHIYYDCNKLKKKPFKHKFLECQQFIIHFYIIIRDFDGITYSRDYLYVPKYMNLVLLSKTVVDQCSFVYLSFDGKVIKRCV